jgi:cytochrome c biogenesis protein CcdA
VSGIGYASAFLGGLLALTSPCGGLLLPAFFAYAFPGSARLLARTLVLYAGLVVVLVPLGIGSAAASQVFYGHRMVLSAAAGALLVTFGAIGTLGGGVHIRPLAILAARVRGDSIPCVLVLGAISGLAGFCAGPILGSVLTVAAASGQKLYGAALLAVYAAGMAAPLWLLAAVWDRFDLAHRRWLRGRGFRIGRVELHTTTLASGLIFIVLGTLMLFSPAVATALFAAPEASAWQRRAQTAVAAAQAYLPDLPMLIGIAVLTVLLVLGRSRFRRSPRG